MESRVDDIRIRQLRPLIPPAILMEELQVSEGGRDLVAKTRASIEAIMSGADPRLLVVVGPCSVHDVSAARDYARKLMAQREALKDELEIVMRVYFEKPRTRKGWKGLINDPYLDDSYEINKGLRLARNLLLDVTEMGLPTATEFLDTITPQFVADLVSWGAIGARTTESQVHRELASGLSMPVGFKNGTDGNTDIVVDAIHSASGPHTFLSVTKQGLAAIVETGGNPSCHMILRGSTRGPNYDKESLELAAKKLEEAGLPGRIMVDTSHGNSQKDYHRQPIVAKDLAKQISEGSNRIFGVMIESNLVEGSQKLSNNLVYGQSVTDSCIGWEETERVLNLLAEAVRTRKSVNV